MGTRLYFYLSFFFLSFFCFDLQPTLAKFPTYNVTIINALPDEALLDLRCRSKDDDLGHHTPAFRQSYSWRFRVNFLGSTLYYCSFNWIHGHLTFDAFDNRNPKLRGACGYGDERICLWTAAGDSVNLKDYSTGTIILKYNWEH
ncbi:hypothetical protein Nepgr_033327 [Nepenthes gracilis]|uniref:S-protein homolog n=1 Tax=Nepenthes gracilis TaxID=150966 RepID=A0AAD3Y8K7_NEPGR|nr:hypothetical protein Nepgr_033327 [Nepenthes gracilis]